MAFEFLRLPYELQREVFYRMHVFDRIKLTRLVLPRGHANTVLYKRGVELDGHRKWEIDEDIYLSILVLVISQRIPLSLCR